MGRKLLIGFLFVGAIAMLTMSIHYLHQTNSGILKRKEVATSLWYVITFRTHVLFGLLAIIIGPFQFIRRFRVKFRSVHRGLGYVYFLSVILSSLSGLVIAQYSMGGSITASGFTVLSILWFVLTIKSFLALFRNDIIGHRKWSYLGYSLTFAAITQRTLLLVPLFSSIPFIPIYRLSAWLPWMLNLGVAHLLLKASYNLKTNRVR